MDVNNHHLSLSLYNYLCKVVGSEDVVRTRRRIFNANDYVVHGKNLTYISSGSKAEGLDLDGSDYDLIMVLNFFPVYEDIADIGDIIYTQEILHQPLVIDTNETKPGYTRLQYFSMNRTLCHIDQKTFLSNKYILELNMFDGAVIHGPCNSHPSGIFDFVAGLYCKKWISHADEWKHRSRLTWPHNRLIETIVQHGTLFVPIGCKNSPTEEFEFRISFNVAEKILVNSFSHVQLLCYALLKIILSNLIKPQYGELLCSYFLKTIMFWVSEETVEESWKPHNFLRCFDRCFKRLLYCVTYSTCLHYFIPELNFFEERFSKSEHEALTSTLQRLYNSGLQFVLQIDLLSPLIYSIGPSATRKESSVSALQSVDNIVIAYETNRVYRLIFGALHFPGKEIYVYILSRYIQKLAQITPTNEFYYATNTQKYGNYRKCLCLLLQGLHHDAVSGSLLLASFFYRFRQYQQCFYMLNYCLHKCTPDKILLNHKIDTELQHKFNTEIKQHIKNSFLRSCKRRVIDSVRFEEKSCIIPEELSSAVENNIATFPPVVFANFLHCICLHRLNRSREKMYALRDLEITVQELYFIIPSKESFNFSYECLREARKLLLSRG